MQAFNNFYFVVGLSWKNYASDNKLKENLLSAWSWLINIVLLLLVVIFSYSQFTFKHKTWEDTIKLCMRIFFIITACLVVLWSPLKRNKEEEFWALLEKLKPMDRNKITTFVRTTAFKLAVMMASLIAQFLTIFFAFLLNSRSSYANSNIRIFTNIAVCRIFRLKFIFFMDVFNFYLEQLKLKYGQQVTQKDLSRSIKICWRLIGTLENIFGLPILLNWITLFNVAILNAFNIYVAIDRRFLSFSPLYNSLLCVFEVFFTADAYQKCVNSVVGLRAKLFAKSFDCGYVEANILQLHHQKMKFSTKNMIDADREIIISVSFVS